MGFHVDVGPLEEDGLLTAKLKQESCKNFTSASQPVPWLLNLSLNNLPNRITGCTVIESLES